METQKVERMGNYNIPQKPDTFKKTTDSAIIKPTKMRVKIMQKRQYTPEYKAKIVLEILREENTVSEIAPREDISTKQLHN